MVRNLDEAYRQTDEYKEMLDEALARYPKLNQSLFDMALCASWANPKAWRDKKRFPHDVPAPTPSPEDLEIKGVTVEPPESHSVTLEEVEDDAEPPVRQPCDS